MNVTSRGGTGNIANDDEAGCKTDLQRMGQRGASPASVADVSGVVHQPVHGGHVILVRMAPTASGFSHQLVHGECRHGLCGPRLAVE